MPEGTAALDIGLFAALAARVIERLPRDLPASSAKQLIGQPHVLGDRLRDALTGASTMTSWEWILERLQRLDDSVYLHMRSARHGFGRGSSDRWYLSPGQINNYRFYNGPVRGNHGPDSGHFGQSGPSPEAALKKTWEWVLAWNEDPAHCFMRRDVQQTRTLPEGKKVMFVRWDPDSGDWVDARPDDKWFNTRHFPRKEICSFAEFLKHNRIG